jgi:hypothetical protein
LEAETLSEQRYKIVSSRDETPGDKMFFAHEAKNRPFSAKKWGPVFFRLPQFYPKQPKPRSVLAKITKPLRCYFHELLVTSRNFHELLVNRYLRTSTKIRAST